MDFNLIKKLIGIFIILIGYLIFHVAQNREKGLSEVLTFLSIIINIIGLTYIFYFTLH